MKITDRLRFGLLFLPLFLWCCAASPPREQVTATVHERADAYWQARVKGRFSKAYELESPQLRKAVSLDDYYKTFPAGPVMLAAQVVSVSLEGDTAVVTVALAYRPGATYTPKGGLKQELRDYWSLIDGQWYHRMKDPRKHTR